MDTLFLWVRNIVSFLLILTVVLELLPAKDYGKYVRVTAGILLLMVIIHPLAKYMGAEVHLHDIGSWEKFKSQMELNGIGETLSGTDELEKQRVEMIIEEYKKNIMQQIRQKVNDLGFDAGEIVLEVNSELPGENFGQILWVEIYDLKEVKKEQEVESGDKIEIESITIGKKNEEATPLSLELIVQLKQQLAVDLGVDIEQIRINGG